MYTCEECGGEFEKGRPDGEADQEALELWGVKDASTHPAFAIICEDCFSSLFASDDDRAPCIRELEE